MRRVISTRIHVVPFTSPLTEPRVWRRVQTSYCVGDARHVFRSLQSSAPETRGKSYDIFEEIVRGLRACVTTRR